MPTRVLETDYLVVGAGAMGMAFTDALIGHADVHVTLVDRRHAAGGHWQDAYPFVQLHQASRFYGVGVDGARHRRGPAARARRPGSTSGRADPRSRTTTTTSCTGASSAPGRSRSSAGSEHRRDGAEQLVTSRVSGETRSRSDGASTRRRRHLPLADDPGDHTSAVRRRRRRPRRGDQRAGPPGRRRASYVVVGSGKTATDGIVWLLANGVAQDADRVGAAARSLDAQPGAVVQPDPGGGARARGRDDGGGRAARVARRGVPAPRGGRGDAAHRPPGVAHDGEVPDPRRVGARAAAHAWSASSASGTSTT